MQSSIKKKLDNMEETPHHEHVDHDMAHLIQKARQDKEWTQKDLGMVVLVYPNLTAFSLNRDYPLQHINEKAEVVRDYENGKAIPNSALIVKMEKALGVKLRGPKAGRPIVKQQPAAVTSDKRVPAAKGKGKRKKGHKREEGA